MSTAEPDEHGRYRPAPGFWAGGNSFTVRCKTCLRLNRMEEGAYRCAHCDYWFCKRCALKHFARPNYKPRLDLDALDLAILFHHAYERLAPSVGYDTRKETRVFDPESPNGKLMVAVCAEILKRLSAATPVQRQRTQEGDVPKSIADGNCAPRPDSESPGSTSPPTLADGKRDFAGGRETGTTAVQQLQKEDDAYRKGYQDAMAFVRSGSNQGTEGKP